MDQIQVSGTYVHVHVLKSWPTFKTHSYTKERTLVQKWKVSPLKSYPNYKYIRVQEMFISMYDISPFKYYLELMHVSIKAFRPLKVLLKQLNDSVRYAFWTIWFASCTLLFAKVTACFENRVAGVNFNSYSLGFFSYFIIP